MRVALVLPTYNEAGNIVRLINEILSAVDLFRIFVVDDNSPDGTADVIVREFASDNRVELLKRPSKLGLKSAYQAGFARALESGAEAVVQMDADYSHRPTDLLKIIEGLKTHDLVVGSRYIKGASVQNWTLIRRIVGWCASRYIRLILNLGVADPLGGFNGFRTTLLRQLPHQKLVLKGYSFQIELKWHAIKKGAKIVEVPIDFDKRLYGKSKIPWLNTFYVLIGVLRLRFLS
jgi:dolichol-phosphate mannosyltransferase